MTMSLSLERYLSIRSALAFMHGDQRQPSARSDASSTNNNNNNNGSSSRVGLRARAKAAARSAKEAVLGWLKPERARTYIIPIAVFAVCYNITR